MKLTQEQRPILIAAIVAASLLLLSGASFRLTAAYLDRPGDSAPLPRGTLTKALAMDLNGWEGRDKPVEESVVEAADCDDCVSRTYTRRGESVLLWIAYGVRARDLMPHRPEVCYPGAGWTLDDSRPIEVPLGGAQPLDCQVYKFSRAGFGSGDMVVLNYYIVDGQYSPDVSLLRSKASRGTSAVHYMAQVQIVTSAGGRGNPDAAEESVRAFAADSAKAIRGMMPDALANPAAKAAEPGSAGQPAGAGA